MGAKNPSLTQACVNALPLPITGISLGMRPANQRRRHIVTMSLIGWVHT